MRTSPQPPLQDNFDLWRTTQGLQPLSDVPSEGSVAQPSNGSAPSRPATPGNASASGSGQAAAPPSPDKVSSSWQCWPGVKKVATLRNQNRALRLQLEKTRANNFEQREEIHELRCYLRGAMQHVQQGDRMLRMLGRTQQLERRAAAGAQTDMEGLQRQGGIRRANT